MLYTLKIVHLPGQATTFDDMLYRGEIYDQGGSFVISARAKTAEEARKNVLQAYEDAQEVVISSEQVNL